MATKAYLMVRVKKEFCQNARMEEILAHLETIPEVKCIEQVDGVCDLLVQIEAPIRAVFIANKVLVLDWVEHLSMLKVEPLNARGHQELARPEVLYKAKRNIDTVAASEQREEKEIVGTKS